MYNNDMKTVESILPIRWMQILCILAGLYALVTCVYIFIETGKPLSSTDFHQFWYAGHYIIQGRDPYEAFFEEEAPALPVVYLDGVIVDQYPVAQPKLGRTPTNTPMIVFLLTPFSYFSWPVAKWAFLVVNLILALVTGWLVITRIPFGGIKLSRVDEIFLLLVYFDFSATRIAIENGQTTLLVFLLMLVALLYADRSWPIAGLSLGIALSKYSLSLPMFLFLLYKKKFKVLLLAIAIQILGILGLAAVSGNSPVKIVSENLRMFFILFNQTGVNLSRWFEFLSENSFVSVIAALVMTLLVFIPIFFWLRRQSSIVPEIESVIDFHVLTILFIWTILVAYHRFYDTLILIVFVVLVFKGLARPETWKLSDKGRAALLVFMVVLSLIFILPARIVDIILPSFYGRISNVVTASFLVIMLVISMFLLLRFLQNVRNQNTVSNELP
jgi:hypothetical protein